MNALFRNAPMEQLGYGRVNAKRMTSDRSWGKFISGRLLLTVSAVSLSSS